MMDSQSDDSSSKAPASPPCYAADADDAYMGYASRDEIIAALNILLEAERAGAFVAMASFHLGDAGFSDLMHEVHLGESHWCAMLHTQIERLGGTPSTATGDFREKVLAITDAPARLAFLNRGQGWVARRLRELAPRIRDEELHGELLKMRDAHDAMIAQVNAMLPPALRKSHAQQAEG